MTDAPNPAKRPKPAPAPTPPQFYEQLVKRPDVREILARLAK